jgi:hypothetical protein
MADGADDQDPKKKLAKDGISRLEAARIWKSLWDLDLRECYFFGSPQRQRQIQSTSSPSQQRLLDAAELNTDLAFELCGDFATEVINGWLSEAANWCERKGGGFISEDEFKKIADQVKAADNQIFALIKASNFYAEIAKAFDPDLSIGTVALWIDPAKPGGMPWVMAVPIREFEIDLGPNGEIDTRFAVRWTKNMYVETLLGPEIWAKVGAEIKKTISEKPTSRTELRWGFWRLWDRHEDEVWQHVVYVKNDLVHDCELIGEGSCPMIVMRWNPNPDWPWGHGPLMQGLPSLRQIDEFEVIRTEHAEFAVKPPLAYPNDSFSAIEQGLEPGMAYPVERGSGNDIKAMYTPPPADPAVYEYEAKEHRLRKLFYVDYPQQSGDTPPTLGQWLDELARAQRRIGRPGLPFWREGPAQIFMRFKYLAEKAGAVQPIKIDGKTISLMPYNPTQRAAEQQEIATNFQALQVLSQIFPEEFKVRIDGADTMKNIIAKMRASLITFRDKDQVEQAITQMAQFVKGKLGDAGGQGGGDPGTTPRIA